jgi:hypothetical protein
VSLEYGDGGALAGLGHPGLGRTVSRSAELNSFEESLHPVYDGDGGGGGDDYLVSVKPISNRKNSLMMRRMVVMVFASFGSANARRRSSPVNAIHIKDAFFILDTLRLSPLLGVDSLQPQHIAGF